MLIKRRRGCKLKLSGGVVGVCFVQLRSRYQGSCLALLIRGGFVIFFLQDFGSV